MRLLTAVAIAFLACASAIDPLLFFQEEMVEQINSMGATWKAGINSRFQGVTVEDIKNQMGTLEGGTALPVVKSDVASAIPDTFDARTEWPQCSSIGEIGDQGSCGSCWAFAAADAMTDRYCITFNQTAHISATDLASCCKTCGTGGCTGGFPAKAWQYWDANGVVTGGLYDSHQGCRPYTVKPCEHGITGQYSPCTGKLANLSYCSTTCESGYNSIYNLDKHFGSSAYSISKEVQAIQTEIMTNGPVEASMKTFSDFISYKSGVYKIYAGDYLGIHAVRIIGWGTENNIPYWLVANSWNTDWGDHGFFKIIRGKDEGGLESAMVAGLPKKFTSN